TRPRTRRRPGGTSRHRRRGRHIRRPRRNRRRRRRRMGEPLVPTTGWAVLHLFCRVTPALDREAVVAAVKSAEADGYQVVPVAVLGHKADLALMVLGPDWWRLRRLQADVERAGLAVADSYVSLTEVSEYAQGVPDELKQARLYPRLPPDGKRAWCFYPMSKLRR